MEKKEEIKKEVKAPFTVGEVNIISGTQPALFYEGNHLSELEAIALILNKLDELKRSIG